MKNIEIIVGGEERRFSAGRLVTEDPGGGQVTWVPADEAGVILEKTIEKAGTYHATDEGAAGYAVVHVKGGGGGGVLRPLKKIGIIDTLVPLKVRLTVGEGEGNMAIVDTTNAKIEALKPVLSSTWLGFNASGSMYYRKNNDSIQRDYASASYSKSESATTGAIVLTGTPTWAGTEVYIGTTTSSSPLYKVSGISYESGDTLALTIGIELEG